MPDSARHTQTSATRYKADSLEPFDLLTELEQLRGAIQLLHDGDQSIYHSVSPAY